jgi:hypothetical protein
MLVDRIVSNAGVHCPLLAIKSGFVSNGVNGLMPDVGVNVDAWEGMKWRAWETGEWAGTSISRKRSLPKEPSQ